MKHVFGPVPSRRLGRSLGVDLVPFKTCTYDCTYCQLGRTTDLSAERREWVPLADVLEDIRAALSSEPDYITLAGSGEPTLYSRIGEVVAGIRAMTDTPIAILTNGSLLWQEEIRRELLDVHLVVPSLDAGNAATFAAVNRHHASIDFDAMVEGLVAFRKEYTGRYQLEVFLLAGVNDSDAEVADIISCVERIRPDLVQLNTVTRPPADGDALPVPKTRMEEIAAMFPAPTEVIADFTKAHVTKEARAARGDVLDMLRRRPCSLEDIAAGLGIHRNEAIKHVEELSVEGLIEAAKVGETTYYKAL